MTSVGLTPEESSALDVARQLVAAGIPVFIAQSDATAKTGYRPPPRWERTVPDPDVVDRWQPGLALCAVMGCGLDLIDFDPRNGGDPAALDGMLPRVYGVAATPSGGAHAFIASLGVGSRDNVLPGVDVKGGTPEGLSRGFAFIAPTVRISVVTGEPVPYRWVQTPNLSALGAGDASGAQLTARIQELRSASNMAHNCGGPDWWQRFIAEREPQSVPAANRAIAEKLAEVAAWTAESGVGFRVTLLRAALTLGGYVGGGHLDEADVREQLEKAVSAVWGSPDSDDLLWIQQGLDDGAVRPFWVFTAEDELLHSEAYTPRGGPAWTIYRAIGTEPFDPRGGPDQEMAESVVARMYPGLRYATDAGSWLIRGAHVWTERDDLTGWATSTLARLMPLGDPDLPKKKEDYTTENWTAARRMRFMNASSSGSIERKMRAIVGGGDHPAAVMLGDLDTDPEVLWAGGVPWDLRASGEVPTPASWVDPNTPHMRTALCAPNPTVATSRWDAFVAAVLPDPEERAWAFRILSITLTGYPDAAVPVLYGRERSGKTSLVELLVVVLGSYAHAANPKLLSADDKSHDAIIYDLKGRRLSFIDEGPKRGHDATERLKQLTGGGAQTARPMYGKPVTFRPTHTLVMTTNNEPHLTDPALRARLRLIPCNTSEGIVRPLRRMLTERALAEEAPGILAAMMRESAAWLDDRDTAGQAAAPVSIRGLADELAERQDPVRAWVEACTIPMDPGTPGRILYGQRFVLWHQNHPLYRRGLPPTETAFGRRLTELGYPPTKRDGLWYRSLSVLETGYGVLLQRPTPETFMGATLAGSGGFLAGSAPNPPDGRNPSSEPTFLSESGGLAGFSLETSTDFSNSVNDQENTKTVETSREKPATRQNRAQKPTSTSANILGGLSSETRQPNPPQDQVAKPVRRADPTTGRYTKAAQKTAEREAAKLAAAGESVPLPAMVDRAGRITPLAVGPPLEAVMHAISKAGVLTVDVETTGYALGHADYRLKTVQLGDEQVAVVLDPSDPAQVDVIRQALAAAPVLHAHSATADLVPLAYAGLADESAWERMHDTVIPAKLADPGSTGSDPGLKQLAGVVLGEAATAPAADAARAVLFKVNKWLEKVVLTTPVERSGWAQVDSTCTTMIRYAASDVLDTAALAARLSWPSDGLLQRERVVQRITARVAHRGLALDRAHVAALTAEHGPAMAAAAAQVRALGVDNPGSDRQLAGRLTELGVPLPRTKPSARHPDGQPSVAAGVLEGLGAGLSGEAAELVSAVLAYRHHETVLSLYLEPYRALCESTAQGDTPRVRPTVYTLGTDTGRMSCVRPNLQQLPRQGGVRACITADPGHVLVSADFSGVEVRVMAALSQDPTLVRMIQEGSQAQALVESGQMTKDEWQRRYDLHAMVAAQAFGPNFTKADRYTAKRGVFGWAYGGGVPALARQLGVSESTMAAIVDSLQQVAPAYVAWADEVKRQVRAGATRMLTYSGRIIHLPREYPHKGPNYAIQGTARELLVDALLAWEKVRPGTVVLPVHDEIVAMVLEQDAAEATADLVKCMTRELYGVPIVAEAGEPSFAWRDSA